MLKKKMYNQNCGEIIMIGSINPNFYVNVADLMLSKPSKKQQHNFVEDGEVIPIISIEIKDMELVSENEFRI